MREYLAEKRRQEEQKRQEAASAERQRQERERRFQDQQRKEQEAERRQQEYRDQQTAKRNADRERWEAEQAQYNRETEDYARQVEEVMQKDREEGEAQRQRQEQARLDQQQENRQREQDRRLEVEEWIENRKRKAKRDREEAEEQERQEARQREIEREVQREKRKAKRDREEAEEQERQEARQREIERQEVRLAHDREVTETAQQIKDTWQENIRINVPDVAADVSSFSQIIREMRHRGGSYSRTDLIVATDKLVQHAEEAYKEIKEPERVYKWIMKPGSALSDHLTDITVDSVTSEAVNKIWADHEYQRDNPLIHTIFSRIQKVNEVVHKSNPFTEKVSSTALQQIEAHVQKIQGELAQLEANLGSFHASNRYADQPLANPFKRSTTNPSMLHEQMDNPYRSRPPSSVPDNDRKMAPVAGCTNPFRDCSKKTPKNSSQIAKNSQMVDDDPCTNPFRDCSKKTPDASVLKKLFQGAK